MKTFVYVDAFNLYYGCLKNTNYRWLDISKLCDLIFPNNDIQMIKYFTAIVSARPNDPHQPIRQKTYLRALKTIDNLEIIYGQFLSSTVRRPLAQNPDEFVNVLKTEEKGSDVNLASHLLMDGFKRNYEVAIVVSNDSDLKLPIEIVNKELTLRAGILNPQKRTSNVLRKVSRFTKQIRKGPLAASQFPPTLNDEHGTIHKPEGW